MLFDNCQLKIWPIVSQPHPAPLTGGVELQDGTSVSEWVQMVKI